MHMLLGRQYESYGIAEPQHMLVRKAVVDVAVYRWAALWLLAWHAWPITKHSQLT